MLLMGLYSYKSTHARTLAFLAGDKFIEIGASLDPNWLHVINECGIVGYVPKNYIGSFQGSASQCQDFIDGCIEGIHLRSCEGGGTTGRKDQETLQRLVQLRQTAATKRQAPPPPPQRPDSNLCPSSLPSPASGEVSTSFSSQDAADGAKYLPTLTPSASLPTPKSTSAPHPAPHSEAAPRDNNTSHHPSVTTACPSERPSSAEAPATCNSVGGGAFNGTAGLLDVKAASRDLPPGLLRSLVAEVRQTTQISYTTSQQVVTLVLESLSSAVPALNPLTRAIMADHSEVPETGAAQQWWQKSADASLAVQLLEKLRQCKDDEQQRSWALREDLPTITRHLQQLLDVLRNGEVSAVREVLRLEDYRPLLTLVQYYQMETRSSLRRLLLQIFSASCQLSAANASFLATSILPVELAREMLSPDTPTEGLESCACLLVLLLASCDALPYTHYTILNGSLVSLLLDGIEQHSSEPNTEHLAHLYMMCLLAFNLHDWPRNAATEPAPDAAAGTSAFDTTHSIVLQLLGTASSTTYFAEKLLLLFNREEDPLTSLLDTERGGVRPHSVLRMVEDLYSYRATAELFYTNDERVLCDILLRQLTDLAPQDERRGAYVSISAGVLVRGRWLEHQHRLSELRDCFTSILRDAEETDESVVAVVGDAVKAAPQLMEGGPQ